MPPVWWYRPWPARAASDYRPASFKATLPPSVRFHPNTSTVSDVATSRGYAPTVCPDPSNILHERRNNIFDCKLMAVDRSGVSSRGKSERSRDEGGCNEQVASHVDLPFRLAVDRYPFAPQGVCSVLNMRCYETAGAPTGPLGLGPLRSSRTPVHARPLCDSRRAGFDAGGSRVGLTGLWASWPSLRALACL